MQESLWTKSLAVPKNVKGQTAPHQGIYPRVMKLVFTQKCSQLSYLEQLNTGNNTMSTNWINA